MAWKEENPTDWKGLRDLLTSLSEAKCLSCRGDPGGHPTILSSIDVTFKCAAVPADSQAALEQFALARFIQQAAPHIPEYQLSFLFSGGENALMLMRHHGGPTRLVDWTESVWVAAFFAMQKDFDRDGTIWVLDRHAYDRTVGKLHGTETPQALPPRSNRPPTHPGVFYPDDSPAFSDWVVHMYAMSLKFPRLIAQQGHFTLASRLGQDHAKLIDDVFVQVSSSKTSVPHTKIIVPKAIKQTGLYALERMGITGASMYPGIDGVCKHLQEFVAFGHDDPGVRLHIENYDQFREHGGIEGEAG